MISSMTIRESSSFLNISAVASSTDAVLEGEKKGKYDDCARVKLAAASSVFLGALPHLATEQEISCSPWYF